MDIKDRILNNKLRLITVKKNTALFSINLGVKVGSFQDNNDTKGSAHFIEHMLFTGTNKRNHEKVNEDIENLAGEVNAFTDVISTIYTMIALSNEFENALDLLSDMIINSTFNKEELERERSVIISEYKESLEDLETVSFNELYKNTFIDDPLRLNVIGTKETISKIDRKTLLDEYQKYYVPSNSTLVVVSNFEHEYVENLVSNYFNDWKDNIAESINELDDETNKRLIFYSQESSSVKENNELATVSLIYDIRNLPKNLELPLKILNHKLGDSDNSLLFQEIRLKRGLAYDIYSDLDLTENVKTIEIYCAVNGENIKETKQLILDTIDSINTKKFKFYDKNLDL